MSAFVGAKGITNISIGSTAVNNVYVGDTLVWSKGGGEMDTMTVYWYATKDMLYVCNTPNISSTPWTRNTFPHSISNVHANVFVFDKKMWTYIKDSSSSTSKTIYTFYYSTDGEKWVKSNSISYSGTNHLFLATYIKDQIYVCEGQGSEISVKTSSDMSKFSDLFTWDTGYSLADISALEVRDKIVYIGGKTEAKGQIIGVYNTSSGSTVAKIADNGNYEGYIRYIRKSESGKTFFGGPKTFVVLATDNKATAGNWNTEWWSEDSYADFGSWQGFIHFRDKDESSTGRFDHGTGSGVEGYSGYTGLSLYEGVFCKINGTIYFLPNRISGNTKTQTAYKFSANGTSYPSISTASIYCPSFNCDSMLCGCHGAFHYVKE